MRKIFLLLFASSLLGTLIAQPSRFGTNNELGLSIGLSTFLGDLGGAAGIGRGFVYDLDFQASRPVVAIFYRNNIGSKFSLRTSFSFAYIAGDDNNTKGVGSSASRLRRNLNFKSHIAELSVIGEYNLLSYEVGSITNRWTPFVLLGVGVANFDPQGKHPDTGEWHKLQPLGTEGQGSSAYPGRKPYSLIQPVIPFGAGVKYNLNNKWSFTIEIANRQTFTDYLDDVSKTYVDPSRFIETSNGNEEQFLLAARMADPVLDIDAPHLETQQRGDPKDFDTYVFAGMISIGYVLNRRPGMYKCPAGFGF